MIALPGVGDITAAPLVGSSASLMGEPVNRSLLKWKLQVKLMTTRITVVRRFARSYRTTSFQYAIAPGLTAASPQLTSKAKNQGSKTSNHSTGALFSPKAPVHYVQDAPKQKSELRTSEKKEKGFSLKTDDICKDHLTSTIQLLLTLLTFKIVKEADLLDEATGVLIIVTVITLASTQEGTTATYNLVVRTVSPKVLILLLCVGNFAKSGVNAQAYSEDGKQECSSERTVDLPYIVQIAIWTFVAMMAFNVIAGRINRRPGSSNSTAAVPATAAAPLAVPPPDAAPPALPAAAAAPPAVPVAAIPLIGFINVMDGLEDPNPARISNPDFHILPPL